MMIQLHIFLWEEKKARIKLSKLCGPKDKGGLSLPDLRLYGISFEIPKLAKYWKLKDNMLDWIDIENKLCLSFSPNDKLFQRSNTTNPIFTHSREV